MLLTSEWCGGEEEIALSHEGLRTDKFNSVYSRLFITPRVWMNERPAFIDVDVVVMFGRFVLCRLDLETNERSAYTNIKA